MGGKKLINFLSDIWGNGVAMRMLHKNLHEDMVRSSNLARIGLLPKSYQEMSVDLNLKRVVRKKKKAGEVEPQLHPPTASVYDWLTPDGLSSVSDPEPMEFVYETEGDI